MIYLGDVLCLGCFFCVLFLRRSSSGMIPLWDDSFVGCVMCGMFYLWDVVSVGCFICGVPDSAL